MSKYVTTVLAFVSSGVVSPFAIFAGLDVELRGRSLERASMTREDTLFGECRHVDVPHLEKRRRFPIYAWHDSGFERNICSRYRDARHLLESALRFRYLCTSGHP